MFFTKLGRLNYAILFVAKSSVFKTTNFIFCVALELRGYSSCKFYINFSKKDLNDSINDSLLNMGDHICLEKIIIQIVFP